MMILLYTWFLKFTEKRGPAETFSEKVWQPRWCCSGIEGNEKDIASTIFHCTSSTTISLGLFGKSPASATPSVDPSSSGSRPQPAGDLGLQTGVPSFGESQRGSGFGIASVDSSDQDSVSGVKTLFGKPIPAAEPSSTTSTAQETVPSSATFGGLEPNRPASYPVSETKALFGKPIAASAILADEAKGQPLIKGGLFGKLDKTDHAPWSRKADSKEKGFGSKRPLIEMEEEEGGREKDLSDLETFGAVVEPTERQKRNRRKRSSGGKVCSVKLWTESKERKREDRKSKMKKVGCLNLSLLYEISKRHRVSITDRQRTASPDEIKRITSIVCKDIPPGLNLRGLLVDIFQEYGEVVKVSCHPDSASAIIYFADHSSASRAKRKVKYLKRGTPPVSIYWASPQSKGSTPEKVKPKTTNIAVRSAVRSEVTKERTSVSPSKRSLVRREELATSSSQPETSRKTSASLGALEGRISKQPVSVGDYGRERRLIRKGAREQKVCHSATVKEYSRSSADQELPLPSDLRPPPVLDMTMNYLMNNIMDKDLKEEGFSWGSGITSCGIGLGA
ncbi:putative germinal-center associated nuclear protein [Apostichopus japonicus]|uniref:Putative germinal-center associated nuclear protein n=1 Tax=Stichopus japonicus TaxID=307972 RepID=A0A2G8JF79_STIJA|nr:putative germinal-center associated nuclear protein [Apostichopus japonicus]